MSESTLPLLVHIALEYADRVNFGMQQNGVPLVDSVTITNNSGGPMEDVVVTLSLQNGECEPWVGRVARIETSATCKLNPKTLSLNAEHLAKRTEAERTHMRVEVRCASKEEKEAPSTNATDTAEASSANTPANENQPAKNSRPQRMAHRLFPVDLLAFDHWPGVGHWPAMTAAFVTPNHPRVASLLKTARQSLGELTDSDSLNGYQSNSRQRAAKIAEACYNAAATWKLGYINPPASFEQQGQRVRLVDRLARDEMGTCLDLAFLLASLWEQCGLHPLILLPHGHAMPALWTHEAHLSEPAIDEPAHIRNLIELGEIVVVESTMLTSSANATGSTFEQAVQAARQTMQKAEDTFTAIDIRTCRKLGIRPLPLHDDGHGAYVDLTAAVQNAAPTAAAATLDRITLAERAEQQQRDQVREAEEKEAGGRIERWRTRLLDLSLRNRLLNFRESARTVPFNVPDVSQLEDMLADAHAFTLLPKSDETEAFLKEEIKASHLHSSETSAEMNKRLLTLYRTARMSIEETGANLLYLAVGMLKWYEDDSSQTARYAPIILLPVQLKRSSSGSGYRYTLSLTDEPLRPNVTLLEKLRIEFGLSTADLQGLPEDENGLDVPLILRNFRAAIRNSDRWEVDESVQLGLFSFNKFLMWRDLTDNLEQLRKNRLIKHLVDEPGHAFDDGVFPLPEELDEKVKPGELFCTRDADSTQLAAIQAAALNKSYVLEGPPGTGKSQTIANIVADSLARGKRVLFVAEKMAALGVVRKRLDDDGLGAFCLELHSAKASKKEVLAQMDAALNLESKRAAANWSAHCKDLGDTRHKLNDYVQQLHAQRPTGESIYKMLGRLSLLGDGPRVELPAAKNAADLANTSQDQLRTWREAIAKLVITSKPIHPPAAHRLQGVGQSEWRFDLPDQARGQINAAAAAMTQLTQKISTWLERAQVQLSANDLSRMGVHAVATLASLLRQYKKPVPSVNLITGNHATALITQIRQTLARGQDRDEKRNALLQSYREEFLELDHLTHLTDLTQAQKKFAPLRWLANFSIRRKLRAYATNDLPVTTALQADLETARFVKNESKLLREMASIAQALGPLWNDGQADWTALEQLLSHCEKVRNTLNALSQNTSSQAAVESLATLTTQGDRLTMIEPAAAELITAWNQWNLAWDTLKLTLCTNTNRAFGKDKTDWPSQVQSKLANWQSGLGELDQWCPWQGARDNAIAQGLGNLVDLYEQNEITRDQLPSVFERSFGEKWFNTIANDSPAIVGFNLQSHEAAIRQFGKLDRTLIDQTSDFIGARLAANTPNAQDQVSSQSEIGILRRELQKKSRHLPTRKLIESIPNLMARLKPCFLMSPLSVAQYLDASLPPFDLVVFDEASQIPVWDAVGAIARGSEVIVVGDSKQLPPTSFFSTVDEPEEDEDSVTHAVEDMESILKECNASGIPGMQLRWHYRSRHETLIAFSNHHYYENKLHTFPSPADRSDVLGVTLHHVADGMYDRGGSRTNRIEAARVVARVVELLKQPDATGSIGIVTFNQAQQMLIEDLLDAARRDNPAIEKFFTQEVHEAVFVKNLENVQGDERDTIIFSVGYGPDQTGRPSMNFGPLNKDGGERRLNVAVTRSRYRLMVFSSLKADQIDLRRTQALGVRHFKTFLDYADRGPVAIAEAVTTSHINEFESSFEKTVCNALTARGWQVHTQVGCAGYRIDLAIVDPQKPGRYILGIECDGATYHSAKTARDRDRIRQAVLEGLGWSIQRVWSTQWRINPQRCLNHLEQVLEAIQRDAAIPATPAGESLNTTQDQHEASSNHDKTDGQVEPSTDDSPAANEVSSVDSSDASDASVVVEEDSSSQYASAATAEETAQAPQAQAVYELAKPSSRGLSRMDIYEDKAMQPAVDALNHMVNIEGPLVQEFALRRLAEWFDVQRVTDRFRTRYVMIERRALRAQTMRLEAGVYWPAGMDSQTYTMVRTPGKDPQSCRDLEHVPLVERVNAVRQIVEAQFGLPEAELQREVARVFGANRVTARIGPLLDEAIGAAVAQGKVTREGEQISLS